MPGPSLGSPLMRRTELFLISGEFSYKKSTAEAVLFLIEHLLQLPESNSGAFEKVIFRRGARDFGLDLVLKDEGILCVPARGMPHP